MGYLKMSVATVFFYDHSTKALSALKTFLGRKKFIFPHVSKGMKNVIKLRVFAC
jgi:hypothetical protein